MPTASDKEKEIHNLVIQKDDLAFARLCDTYYEPVCKKIKAFNRWISAEDETLVMDVVTDSFMNYFNNPQRYDPQKQSLEGFLLMDIEGDLKNAWEKIKRHHKKMPKPVGLYDRNGNETIENRDLNAIDHLIDKENTQILEQKLKALFKDEKDIQVAHLMLAGERRSSEYAKLLRIEHLETEKQGLEIKRCKDRIDKTIKRKFSKGF
jgi:DNA-directed RNA polymerase specialized sigma24 family protein